MKTLVLAALLGSLPVHPATEPRSDDRAGSVYALDGALTDSSGQRTRLDLFRGHPVLISMFYGSCPQACPLLIARLKLLESQLPAAVRAQTRVVLVSLDPERDTPAVLDRLLALHGVDRDRWRMLSAPSETVEELAAVLGINFHRVASGAIWHTSVITVLDAKGRIAARAEGLDAPLAPLVEQIEQVAQARPSPATTPPFVAAPHPGR